MKQSPETRKLNRIVGYSNVMMRKCDEAIANANLHMTQLERYDLHYDIDKDYLIMTIAMQVQLKETYASILRIIDNPYD